MTQIYAGYEMEYRSLRRWLPFDCAQGPLFGFAQGPPFDGG